MYSVTMHSDGFRQKPRKRTTFVCGRKLLWHKSERRSDRIDRSLHYVHHKLRLLAEVFHLRRGHGRAADLLDCDVTIAPKTLVHDAADTAAEPSPHTVYGKDVRG